MSTITPILDTLLHQVFGRRADIERFTATQPNAPLGAIARIVAARDGTARTDTLAQRAANARQADLGLAGPARGSTRAAAAATPERNPAGESGMGTAPAPPGSAALHFSREARSIAALLGRFAQAPTATTQAQAPLFSGQHAPLAPVLASLLGRQLVDSGVFYESHLSKWIEGRHTLAQLAQEPQAQINRPVTHPSTAASTQPGSATASGPSDPSAGVPARADLVQGNSPAAGAGLKSGAHAPASKAVAVGVGIDGGAGSDDLIHDSLLPVVRQQFDVLSSAVFRWQGMAWPGVPMQWEVREHEHDPDSAVGAAEEPGSRYSTRINLELPTLGPLQVRMSLSAGSLHMYAWAGSDTGVDALRPQTAALEARLQRAGFAAAHVRLITGASA